MKKIFTNIYNRIFFDILIFLCMRNYIFLLSYFMSILLNLSGDRIYFCTYKKKEVLVKYLNILNKEKLNYDNMALSKEDNKILSEIKSNGISSNFNLNLKDDEIANVKKYFKKSDFYDSHTPLKKNKKENSQTPSGAYISFDNFTQLNCEVLLKCCLNDRIVNLAAKYLGSFPYLYGLNTFVTFPNSEGFTHTYHRDHDNIKWLVFFINWTDTFIDNGAFQQLLYTHSPSPMFNKYFLNNDRFKNFDDFVNKSLGYESEFIENKEKDKDMKNLVFSSFGKAGSITVCDTFGLHRGTPVKNPRLVTWIRFGVRQGRHNLLDENLNSRVSLDNDELLKIYHKSKNNKVLKYLLK